MSCTFLQICLVVDHPNLQVTIRGNNVNENSLQSVSNDSVLDTIVLKTLDKKRNVLLTRFSHSSNEFFTFY